LTGELGAHRVVILDGRFGDVSLERALLEAHGCAVAKASCRSEENVLEAIRDCDAALVQSAPVTARVFRDTPRLKLVSCYGTGVDNVDLDAARGAGAWVCNVRDYATEEVAVHAAALMLAVVRALPASARAVAAGEWQHRAGGSVRRLSTLTLSLIGCGRIGRAVSRDVGHLFRNVIGFDPQIPASQWPEGIERVDLDSAFRRGDVVSLHLPLTSETRGMVSRDLLARLPSGAVVINTARGGLLDLVALSELIDSGRIRGAGLDVLPSEPPTAAELALVRQPNVIVTPHAAWFSEESERDLRRLAVENITSWLTTGAPHTWAVQGRSTP